MSPAPLSLLFDLFPQELQEHAVYPKNHDAEIPRKHWDEGDFYHSVSDMFWLALTGGKFPARTREDKITHPLFVVSSSSYGHKICPCTTFVQYDKPTWHVPSGVQLENARNKLEKDVYVLKLLARPISYREKTFKALYMGSIAPQSLIRRD